MVSGISSSNPIPFEPESAQSQMNQLIQDINELNTDINQTPLSNSAINNLINLSLSIATLSRQLSTNTNLPVDVQATLINLNNEALSANNYLNQILQNDEPNTSLQKAQALVEKMAELAFIVD